MPWRSRTNASAARPLTRGRASTAMSASAAEAATPAIHPPGVTIHAGTARALPPIAPGRRPVAPATAKRRSIGGRPSSDSATMVPASAS